MSGASSVVFAGGGTGGHLFPAIAIAEALKQLVPGIEISFAGSRRKIEASVVPRHGYPFDPVWISGLKRSAALSNLVLPVRILVSLIQSFRLIRKRRPAVVVGTGGYVSAPVVYTAVRLGRKTLIQEQNEYPGIATRRLSRYVDEVHVTFDSTRRFLPHSKKIVVSGNPVRLSLTKHDAEKARLHFGLDPDKKTLFVFGGSQGAASINEAVRDMLPRFERESVQLLWQTGTRDFNECMQLSENSSSRTVVRDFIDEMDFAYSAATLVICRAGATSIAELLALGIPSVLVPYPHAADDHQLRNARALEKEGAAVAVREADLQGLADEVFGLIHSTNLLASISARAASMGHPKAAFDIAEAIVSLIGTDARQGG